MKRAPVLVALSLVTALAATGCSGDDGPSIVVYNAQHEQLLEEIAPKFTEKTGIEVKLRHGKDFELGNQLVQEGDRSPADVFLTENSPAMALVANKGLFAPLPQQTLDRVPAQFRPADGRWTGFAARASNRAMMSRNRELARATAAAAASALTPSASARIANASADDAAAVTKSAAPSAPTPHQP